MKRKSWNYKEVSFEKTKIIRNLFCRQTEMKDIVSEVNLSERIIYRVINEKNFQKLKERYLVYLILYSKKNNVSLRKVSEKAGVKYYSLCRIRKKKNIKLPIIEAWNKRFDISLENKFEKDYNLGLTCKQIAEKYGYKTGKTVSDILKKNGIERRPAKIYTHYKEDFFEKIDSHDKAYILGLIYADGYIIKDYEGFGIQLTKTDEYILEKVRDLVGGSNPITDIDYTNMRKKMKNVRNMSRLVVCNKKISEDLKKLGVLKNKTKILRYNKYVPDCYINSFFRGLMDGDGSIGFAKNGFPWLCICVTASKLFAEDICSLRDDLSINVSKGKNGSCIWAVKCIGGKNNILNTIRLIYENKGDLYLRRKYEKVQNKIS